MIFKRLASTLVLLYSVSAGAETPKILSSSLDAYIAKGADQFLAEMTKGSAMEGEKSILAQATLLSQIESFYGAPKSWEILAVCNVFDTVNASYYLLNYEKGPVYGYLYSYMTPQNKEIATKFIFNTDPEQVLPYFPISKSDICGVD